MARLSARFAGVSESKESDEHPEILPKHLRTLPSKSESIGGDTAQSECNTHLLAHVALCVSEWRGPPEQRGKCLACLLNQCRDALYADTITGLRDLAHAQERKKAQSTVNRSGTSEY